MDGFNYRAWVDVMYQKLEDVGVEVENFMQEEIIGAAESQLQTMGARVTKFFSDLLDDEVPQFSADHGAEERASDLSPVQKSGVMGLKRSETSGDDGHCGDRSLQSSHCIKRRHPLKQNDRDTVHEKSRITARGNPIKENENQLGSLDIPEKEDSLMTTLCSSLDDDAESSDICEKKDSVMPVSSSPITDDAESFDILEKRDSVMKTLSLPLEVSTENSDVLEKKDSVMTALSSSIDDDADSLNILERKDSFMPALSSSIDDDDAESLNILERKDSFMPALSSPSDDDTENSGILEQKDSVTAALALPLEVSNESLDILEKKGPVMEALSSTLDDNTESNSLIVEVGRSLYFDSEQKDSVMAALSLPLEVSNEDLDILEKKDPVMEALPSALDDNTESHSSIVESEASDIDVAPIVASAALTGSIDDVGKVETIQPWNKAKLDESCIMVDRSELHAVPCDVRRTRSDKKKLMLKNIFALRKKAEGGDYDHNYVDVERYQQKREVLSAYEKSELLDDGFSESEWEII